MDNPDCDNHLDLLAGLIELAQKSEDDAAESKPQQPNFASILESLDDIPVKVPSKAPSCFGEKGKNAPSEEKSVVHSGDTDSEDDEDKKYFHNRQYNEYGSSIKKMLESEERSPGFNFQGSSGGHSKSWKNTPKPAPGTLCMPASEVKKPATDLNVDTLLGVRVVNPIVSSVVLSERLNGRKVVPFSDIKTFTSKGKIMEDWVIVGVIVSKSPPRTSAKGSTYSIVRLSDLRGLGDMKSVSVFLFSTACKVHGKNSVGTVLGILNPGVLDNSKNHGDDACLSVDGADRIMVLGTSRDFALCKSKKKNGENCTSFVNRANCEFCIYHVKQEYKQFSRRTELQATFSGKGLTGGLTGLRNKVLGKSEVFYAGQSYTAIPAKKSNKMAARDDQRLSVLTGMASATMKRQSSSGGRLATSVELSHRQTQRDLDRLRRLSALDTNNSANQRPLISASAQNFSQELKVEETRNDALAFISKAREAATSKPALASPQPCSSEKHCSNPLITAVAHAGSPMAEHNPKVQNSTSGTPKTPAQLSRGAALALAANLKSTPTPKGQPSAFGLGNKSSPAAERANNATPPRKPSDVSNCKRNSSPVTIPDCRRTKKLFALIDDNVALQKSPGELKILSKLIESRPSSLGAARVAQETTGPVITKASEFGLGRGAPDLGRGTPTLTKRVPTLSAGASSSGTIEFDLSVNPKNFQSPKSVPVVSSGVSNLGKVGFQPPVNQRNSKSAKLKAVEYIRRNGSIAKEDPNKLELSSKKKAASGNKRQEPRKRKIEEVLGSSAMSKKKLKSVEEEKQKETMAEFRALMEVSSKHVDLVTKADDQAQTEYFDNLEKKEQLEEKMLNTFKVACKAVTCSRCKYTAFSAADICKEERHPLKVHDATKRFFKCADCGNRTCCLEIIPLKTCSNCNSSRWERTSMIRERKVGIGSETLSIRGGEEKFIGSVVTGANLNLLVPE